MCLHLYFNDCHGSFMLPRHLFACESLKVLELDFFYDLRLPTFVYFPNLKILTLSKVIFMDDNSANQLFSSCPKLEKLFLSGCNWRNVKTVHVSAPMLEHLKISEEDEDVADDDAYFEPHCCEFMISGPRIKVFHYAGELKNEYCISEAPSLIVAHIYVYSGEITAERQAANRAHKLLGGIANVKDLRISSLTFEILSGAEELIPRLPLFLNLNHLEVSSNERLDFACEALLKILHNSPHLESICFAARIWLSRDGWQLDQVPPCFLTHLKTSKVKHLKFLEDEEELNAIKTLIKSARVLEDVDLGYKGKNRNNATVDLLKECIKSNVVFE